MWHSPSTKNIAIVTTLGVIALLLAYLQGVGVLPERQLLEQSSVIPQPDTQSNAQTVPNAPSDQLTVPFVRNVGQYADDRVLYAASIFKGAVIVKNDAVVYSLLAQDNLSKDDDTGQTEAEVNNSVSVRAPTSFQSAMELRDQSRESPRVVVFEVRYGNSKQLSVSATDAAQIKVSDFRGNDKSRWKADLTSFESLNLGQLWEKIDVVLRAHARNVEQLFYVQPGASVQDIELKFAGIDGLKISEKGELVIEHSVGRFALTKPLAYQSSADGTNRPVEVQYALIDKFSAGFKVGDYNKNQVLLIDPLLASTYLGGTGEERYAYEGFGGHIYTGDKSVARDASGSVYVLSETLSANFPTTVGVYDGTYNDSSSYLKNDIAVSKFTSGFDTLLASTYLGGTSEDNASALAVDSSGNVYITGFTRSMDFPVVNGNHDITFNGGPSDVFVSKLSGDLSQLLGSTYLGGRKSEASYSLLLDGAGNLYVAGDTSSDNFPIRVGGFQAGAAGATDGFVAKLTDDLTTLAKVTLLGGSGDDYLRSLTRVVSGEIYVVGSSTSTDYPTTVGVYDRTQNLKLDVVVSKLSGDLSTLISSTYLGQNYDDLGYALGVNSFGDVVLGGITESANFPTVAGAYDRTHNGTYDAFVSKFNSSLTTLKESTLLGGANWEDVYALGIDNLDQVFLVGSTRSGDYPTTLDAYKRTLGGNSDGTITKFAANLATVEASTYMGGAGHLDALLGITFDAAWDLITVGVTNSADFPTTPGGYDRTHNGLRDLVVFKITKDLLSDASSSHLEVRDSLGNNSISVPAGASTQIKVAIYDQFGNILPSYNGDYSVIFSGLGTTVYGNAPTCTNKFGAAITFGSSTTLAFSQGVSSCTMRTYKAEVGAVEVSLSSTLRTLDNDAYDLDVTVAHGALSAAGSMLTVSPSPATVTSSVNIGLEARDLYGNPLGAAGASSIVVFSISGANARSINATDLGNGSYSGTYTPNNSGYDNITSTINAGGVGSDTEGTRDGTFHLTVNALGLDHLEVRYENPGTVYNTSGLFQAALSYTVVVFARDALGNNVLDYDGWKGITLSGPALSPYGNASTCSDVYLAPRPVGSGATLNFVDGKASCTFVAKLSEVVSLDATDGYVNSYGATTYDLDLTVSPDSVNHLTVTGSSTQIAGTTQTITITAKDQFGNVHPAYTGDRFLTFSGVSPSYSGVASTVADKTNVPVPFGTQETTTFAAGVATRNMVLYQRGVFSVDVTDGNSTSNAKVDYDLDVTVVSTGVLSQAQSSITTNSNPVGSCGTLVPIITARDAFGNQLESGGHTVVVTVSGANAQTPAVIDNGDGSYFAGYPPSVAGTDTITATIGGLPVGKDTDGTSDGSYVQIVNSEVSNTATWLGVTASSGTAYWHTTSNWQGGVVPTSCYDVIINGSYTYAPVIDHNTSGRVVVKSLSLGSSATSVLIQRNPTTTNYLQVRENFIIGGSGTLTHEANTTIVPHSVLVQVGGDMTVSVGGKVDVVGKGYAPSGVNSAGRGPGAGTVGCGSGLGYGLGATHAGIGGSYSTCVSSQTTYGSISQPITHGSSGGAYPTVLSGAGGGVVKLVVAGSLMNSGQIKADGGDASTAGGSQSGGGAGGSILLDVGSIQANGTITVNGGLGSNTSGGGGGRIALYYTTNTYIGAMQAYGAGPSYGGAGTIYLKDKGATYGRLIVRNNNHSTTSTRGVLGDSYVLEQLDIDGGGYYTIIAGQSLSTVQNSLSLISGTINLEFGGSFVAPNVTSISGNGGVINVQAGAKMKADAVTTLSNVSIYNYDLLSFPNLGSMLSIRFENHGIYNHSSSTLTVQNSSTWVENGSLAAIGITQVITDLIVDNSTLEFRNQDSGKAGLFNSIEVRSGGILTHSTAAVSPTAILNLQLGSLTIQSGGKVDVAARGYLSPSVNSAGRGPGGGTVGCGSGMGAGLGGTYGGIGGTYSTCVSNQNTYGSLSQPFLHGSSGGVYSQPGGSGGGVGKLVVSGVLINSGQIKADGGDGVGSQSGGGAGGSIWLDVGTLQGNGTISANGGLGNTTSGGGGGRIALYYSTNSYVGSVQAYGGGPSYGGAGTIFWKDKAASYGRLVVRNNGHTATATRGVSGDSYTFEQLDLDSGGYYSIVNGQTLTTLQNSVSLIAGTLYLESGGGFYAPNVTSITGNGGVLNVQSGGVFQASAVTALANITLYNYATLSLPNLVSMSGLRFENHGIYNHSSSTLTVSNSSTWVENGSLATIGNISPITDIVVDSAIFEFRNQTTSVAGSFNSLVVNSGGLVRHAVNGTTPTSVVNLNLGSLTVNTGGFIDASGLGYPQNATFGTAGYGPGGGVTSGYGSGGTHGGVGSLGNLATTPNNNTYGSISQPILWGSSGGASGSFGGVYGAAGGGVIKIGVAGTSTINGTLSVAGLDSRTSQSDNGGAGGSIWLTTGVLTGNGVIKAPGGSRYTSYSNGGGGGGRIAIHYTTNSFTGIMSAYGGSGYNNIYGGAGTIYLKDRAQAKGVLTFANNGVIGYSMMPSGAPEAMSTTLISGGAILKIAPSQPLASDLIDIMTAGVLEANSFTSTTKALLSDIRVRSGGVLRHSDNSTSQSHVLNLNVSNLTIDAGGSVDTTGYGFDAGFGTGSSTSNSGAGYGGYGGNGTTGVRGTNYGNMLVPIDLGSGAGGASGGAGGGAMRIQVNNTLTLNGDLRALGNVGGATYGGGSGGSIILSAFALAGNGYISANGGNGTGTGGGGAGGRIAIYYFGQTFLPGGGHITSATPGQYADPVGGTGNQTGANGTLYLSYPDHYIIAGSNTQTAGTAQSITITLIDNFGNPFIWDGLRNVVLSGATASSKGNPATCTNYQGNAIPFDSPMTLDFANGVATCSLALYRVGSHEIDLTDGIYSTSGNVAWDLDVTVNGSGGGTTPSVIYSQLSADKQVASVSEIVTATLTVYDAFGNRITSGGQTVTMTVSGANPGGLSVTDHGNGTFSSSYTANNVGLDQIRSTLSGGPVMDDTDGVPDGVYNVAVIAAPADHLIVTGQATQHAGQGQTIRLTAKSSSGVTDSSYSGNKTVTLSGASASPEGFQPTCRDIFGVDQTFGQPFVLNFENGEATCQMYLYKVEVAAIDASDGIIDSFANAGWDLDVTVSVNPGASAQGRISASPSPAVDNDTIAILVQATDPYGNNWNKTGLSVALQVTGGNTAVPTVTDQGNGTYSASYQAINVGTDQIRGVVGLLVIIYDTDGTSDGVYNLSVLAGVSTHHFEITGSATQVAGSSQQITITAKGAAGQTSPSYRGIKTVTVSGGLTSLKGHVPTCSDHNGVAVAMNQPLSMNFTNGVALCNLVLFKGGAQSIDASDGTIDSAGDPSWDLDVSVSATAVDNASAHLTGSAPSVNTKDMVTALVYGRDQYGNNVASGGASVAVVVSGTNAQTLTVTDLGDGSYRGTYEARNAGADHLGGSFNGITITSDNDGTSDGVYHLVVVDTITATHLEVKGNGMQLAGTAQLITIEALDDGGYRDFGFSGNKATKLSGANATITGIKPFCIDRTGAMKPFGSLMSLAFVNGQVSCQMAVYKVETAHIDAESGTLNSFADPSFDLDVDVQPAGTGVASGLLDAKPNPVVVGGVVTAKITTLDEYGNQTYDSGTVLTGSVTGMNTQALNFIDQADGTYNATYPAPVSGVDNITGTVNSEPITADTDGLSNGTYVLRVISVGFADHLELSGTNTQDVGASQILTVSAKMLGGQTDVSYTGVHEITLSGAHAAPNGITPTCRDRLGVDRALGTSTELNFVDGVATCRMYLYKAELAEIDATDTVISTVGDVAWDLDVTVAINPGGLAQGRISATVTTAIENEVVGLSVQAVDGYGNEWAKTGLAIAFNVTGANNISPVATDNGDGTYGASYVASGVGNDIVRGTVGGSAILYDTEGASEGVYHLSVLAGILPHHFEVTGAASQTAGATQTIAITARALTGEVAPSYRGDKNITLSGPPLALNGQPATCTDKFGNAVAMGSGGVLAFNNGVAQCGLKLYRAGDQIIDATDGSLSSAGDPLWDLDVNVGVGVADNGSALLVGSATSVNTKETVTATVYARDSYWNSVPTGGASVTLAITGANAGNLVVSDLGDGSYSGSYLARYPGADAIRGTFNSTAITHDNEGASDGVYHLVVSDTIVASHLEVAGANTQFSGTFQTVVISAKDSEGYRAYSYQGVKTLKLSGANKSPAGFKPACLDLSGSIKPFGSATVLQFVNGQASCLMVLYQLELAHIDAADNGTSLNSFGNENWDLDVLVQANSGDNQGGVISATPNPAQKGSMIAVTVSISDSFGNALSASGLDVGLSVSGANPQTLTVLDNHDGTYSAQYVAARHGVDFIEGMLNGEPLTADTDGNSDGVYQLTILPLNSTITASPSPAEKGKEVTVEVTVNGTQSGVVVTGLSVALSVNGTNSGNYQAVEIGGGKYRTKYIAANEGVDFITGTVDAALIRADTDGVSDGIFQLPVIGSRGAGGGRFIAGMARYESTSGRPAIGVEVTDGSRSAATNQFGYYVIYDVPNGNYTLSGSKAGYSVYAEPGVNPIEMADAPVVNANLIVSASVPVEVVAPWNSFLGHVVIAEIFNSGTEPLTAELTLYRQEGSGSASDPEKMLVRVPVEQQRDIILNAMKAFKLDSYGVLRIRFSHPYYSGQVSYYKVIPGEVGFRENADQLKKEFDYALANPFVGSTYGKSYVMFNTHQPSAKGGDAEKLVPNWLTIVNGGGTSAGWFTIRKYDEAGKLLVPTSAVGMVNCLLKSSEIRCKVAPFGRIDIDGGHVFPGPNHAGLIEIIPDNLQLPYSANIVRYGMGAPPTVYTEKYDFASYFQARPGSFKEQVMPISTTSGAENWLEIANISSAQQTVTAEYYYYDGEFAGAQNFKLGPKGQVHVNVEPIIGKGRSGVVKLSGEGSNGVIAHNLSYYRLDDRSVYVVTGIQASEPNRARIAGTYNRFLNMSNWLRITNLTSAERKVTLRLHVNQTSEVYIYKLAPYGGTDVPLHDAKYGIGKNTLGMFEIENDDPGAIFAEMYRMKHAETVPFDFVMPTEVR